MTENNPPPSQTTKPSAMRKKGLILLVIFVVVATVGIASRAISEQHLTKKTQANAVASVGVITAQRGAPMEEIVLPGTVQPWHQTIIYARTSGYVKSWAVDIGAKVKQGDILGVIDAPDLDAQFHEAQAELATAQANYQIAELTAKRYTALTKNDSIAQQTADQAVATAEADLASVNTEKANLDYLQQQEDFKNIVAPFDGTITNRNIDIGDLIAVGSTSTTTGANLFSIADTSKLRVYIQIPENDVAAVRPDLTAELHFPQDTQRVFTATFTNSADALDPTTRSLLIELQVDNSDGAILAGSYTDAHIKLPTAAQTVILPVNTLLFRDGMQVGVVKDNHVSLHKVKMGRDYGKTAEIVSGVSEGDIVVINPPDSLQDGQEVHPVPQDQNAQGDQGASDKNPPAKSQDQKNPSDKK